MVFYDPRIQVQKVWPDPAYDLQHQFCTPLPSPPSLQVDGAKHLPPPHFFAFLMISGLPSGWDGGGGEEIIPFK